MLRHAVVPHHHGALPPLHTGLEIGTVRQVVVQELEKRVGLFLLQADDVPGNWIGSPMLAEKAMETDTRGLFEKGGLRGWRLCPYTAG